MLTGWTPRPPRVIIREYLKEESVVKEGYQVEVEIYKEGRWYETHVSEVCFNDDTVFYSDPVGEPEDDEYYNIYVRGVEIDTETGEVDETDKGYYEVWNEDT